MNKAVTVLDLKEALIRLGFLVQQPVNGNDVFEHSPTGTLVVLPHAGGKSRVPRARLAAIRLSIIGRDVASAAEFEEALDAIHA